MQMQFMASWSPMRRWLHADPNSALPSRSEDLSMPYNFTDTSSQTCISVDSSSTTTDLSSKNHMWNHLLLNSGGSMRHDDHDLNNSGEKFLELLSSKTLPSNVFNDYSKDVDNNSGLAHSINYYNGITQFDLASNWSIAPPLMAQHVMSNPSFTKSMACYNYDLKEEKQQQDIYGYHNANAHQIGSGTSVLGLNNHKLCNEMVDAPWSCSRNLSDLIYFDGRLNSTSAQTISQHRVDSKKIGSEISLARPSSSRSSGITTDTKKRKSEDSSEANSKKPKQQTSTTTAKAPQVPKVKLLDKISALQQIVAPFGKTDTASVLLDTYNCIKILHEQIQLFSDPYIKSCASKDHNAIWGGMEARDLKADQDVDLRSRGLCLVPVSCAPEVCQDTGTPDYWAPSYRSCLFR